MARFIERERRVISKWMILSPHDTVMAGDEFFNPHINEWHPCVRSIGKIYRETELFEQGCAVRRLDE